MISAWRRFFRHRTAALSATALLVLGAISAAAPLVTHYSYEEQRISERLQPPSASHWLGTDTLGRDLYSRILYGGRLSLGVGVGTALFSLVVGTLAGAIAGYRGGWVDQLVMRIADLFFIFPSLLLAILLMILLGRGVAGILLAIGLTAWGSHARVVRGQVLQAREMQYVEAARALGIRPSRILMKHILPNLWGPIFVSLTLQIPSSILSESFLSFIGLGLEPPYSSWGTLAAEGLRGMRSYPHLILSPALVLFLTLIAFNLLGDGLSDAFDPNTHRKLDL